MKNLKNWKLWGFLTVVLFAVTATMMFGHVGRLLTRLVLAGITFLLVWITVGLVLRKPAAAATPTAQQPAQPAAAQQPAAQQPATTATTAAQQPAADDFITQADEEAALRDFYNHFRVAVHLNDSYVEVAERRARQNTDARGASDMVRRHTSSNP